MHMQVAATASYAALTKRQADLITAEACAAVAHFQAALQVCCFTTCNTATAALVVQPSV